jgi:hypothetical protein
MPCEHVVLLELELDEDDELLDLEDDALKLDDVPEVDDELDVEDTDNHELAKEVVSLELDDQVLDVEDADTEVLANPVLSLKPLDRVPDDEAFDDDPLVFLLVLAPPAPLVSELELTLLAPPLPAPPTPVRLFTPSTASQPARLNPISPTPIARALITTTLRR